MHRVDLEETLAQRGGARHALRVPAEVLAELERRLARVALQPQGESCVLERGCEALLRSRGRPLGMPLQQISPLGEEPRVPERTTRDHDAGAAGVPAHGENVLRGADVAVADDRNVERLDHAGDLVPIGLPGEHLRARAGMQGERLGTRLATTQRDADRIALRLVPAAANLDRDGYLRRVAHRPNDW